MKSSLFPAVLLLATACESGLAPEPGVIDEGGNGLLDYEAPLPAHYLQAAQGPGGGPPGGGPPGGGPPGGVAAIALDNTPNFNPITNEGAALGRVLFYDPQLSMSGEVSCSSCHSAEHGFADPEVLSEGFDGGRTGRHSMGITNARFYGSGRFFWDERAETLEDQVLMPIQDPVEMGMTLEDVEAIVDSTAYYDPLFVSAFGDDEVDSERISQALAQFVRAMASTTSRYDDGRSIVNDPAQPFPNFTDEENLGKQLFFAPPGAGGAGCVRCHGTDAFVGVGPGVFNNGLDADTSDDEGRYEVTGLPQDRGVFKTPSLRNVGLRPPYMHDGRFDDLTEVVEHYNSGIEPHPNLAPQLRGPGGQPMRLGLSDDEVAAIVAFLRTLDDEEMVEAERFSDPF